MRTHDIDPRKPWFRARRYGWGWRPQTWQGWMITAIFCLATFTGSLLLAMHKASAITINAFVLLLVIALVVICWRTGERPRWRWGGK
jgi:hypothetical protein